MKKTNILLIIIFLVFNQKIKSQITQLELASGISKTDFSYFSIKPLNKKETFSISTLAFFQKYHGKEHLIFDEIGVQTTVFWNINKFLSVGPSLYYNSVAGFSERISLLVSIKKEKFTLSVIPSIAHLELTNFINGELFLQLQFVQPIKKHWKFLLSAQVLSHWDKFSKHSRSFQQIRTGCSYKKNQFGLFVDFDQYGQNPISKTSVGLFFRKIFINN